MSDPDVTQKNISFCISKYKLDSAQAAAFIDRVKLHESNPDPMMDVQLKSDDQPVEDAYSDYKNHSTGYRIGEYGL